ncbi:MAG: gamma-glutamyl-gamma-aminobutyrate hydrolase family protein [Erysipelotrichaceae bacterium]|nr:gamma-glutamyl-gamma-aminobutyrate hydrolase family protein [Erysipelotrichaceae bacterium]
MKIAIAMRLETLDEQAKYFCNETYIKKIVQFHHFPIPICDYAHIEEAATLCDALIIPGGYDILPFYFHQSMQEHCTFYSHFQDTFDFALIQAFVKAKKPILGICRGMQLLALYFQSSLLQHINTGKHTDTSTKKHIIMCMPHSFLASFYPSIWKVNSYHHQIITHVGKELKISAYAMDGAIEAIQHVSLPIFGVQWHPELMEDDHVFEYFFHISSQYSLDVPFVSPATTETLAKP